MIGIDPDLAREAFDLDDSIEPLTALAIGYPGHNNALDSEYVKRDTRKREPKPLSEIIVRCSV